MANDGRLTIRFKDLLEDIELLATDEKRDVGEWVRLHIEKVRDRNKGRIDRLRKDRRVPARA